MYRTTRDPNYLELLHIMIDNRGSRPNPDRDHHYGGTDQTQDRVPLREETMAVGHAVTGNYFYCGAADLYAETGEQPNFNSETCANIAAGMFNYRMFMLTGEAKYADWTEQMMYNTLNSAVDLQGEHWFYANPVSWDGTEGEKILQTYGKNPDRIVPGHRSGQRWKSMNCYCCPPSVTRKTAQIHNWFYNMSDDGALWINF